MSIIRKLRRHGLYGSIRKTITLLNARSGYFRWRFRNAPVYVNPTPTELAAIECDLAALGVKIHGYSPSAREFEEFRGENWFDSHYRGSSKSGVRDEKLLEHWIASQILGLFDYRPDESYVDVAAAGSPWAKELRERQNINAYAIDLSEIDESYRRLHYYRVENATQTKFADAELTGISLQCAYEMFVNDDDSLFIQEVARILRPGGKAVILPLYMHTHYCAYTSPEYYGKGRSDSAAKEYIRLNSTGIPSSRKYDATMLKQRVLDPIEAEGMHYRLLALQNKAEFGGNIYCHFILEIER